MRTVYFKELKKVNESLKTEGAEVYQPSLWYFEQFNFLAKICDPSAINNDSDTCTNYFSSYEHTTSDPVNTEDLMLDNNYSSENYENKPSLSNEKKPSSPNEAKPNLKRTKYKRKHISVNKDQKMTMDNNPRVFTTVTEDWEMFGRCIGLQLRDISQEQLTIAFKLISDTIYYAKLNKLTEDSGIRVDASTPEHTIFGAKLDV